MIPRVRPRSASVREVLRYLFGPGENGEHDDQRLVAAWETAAIGGVADLQSRTGGGSFAARFYSAIASAQPIGPSVRQGAVALDLAGLNEGWKPTVNARDDVDLEQLVLVRPTPE